MSITITENAAQQIKKQLAKHQNSIGLKLGVKKYGCSGYAYTLDYSEQLQDSDTIFENFGVKIIVNQNDLEFINGIQLDYRKEGLNEAFKFDNPNVTGTCGCGVSFSVA